MTDVEAVNAKVWSNARRGVLELRERLERVGFVVGQGVIVLPAHGFMEHGSLEDGALYVPDEREGGLALQVEVRLIEDTEKSSGYGRLLDRWEAYHGRPGSARFAVAVVVGARLGATVVDGDDLRLVNTVANEAPLLRRLNADRRVLERAISAQVGVPVHEPLAVGIDQWGIDVRTRTGVLRVRTDPAGDAAAAAEYVERLLAAGGGSFSA